MDLKKLFTFVSIRGDVVFTANVSAICCDVTKLILVDLGETAALLINKFKPFSPTNEETSSATSTKVSWFKTSVIYRFEFINGNLEKV